MNTHTDPSIYINLRDQLKQQATALGFAELRVTDIELDLYLDRLDQWLEQGYAADMNWIADRRDLRARPDTLVEGTARVITVRMNYRPPDTEPLKILQQPDLAYISRYALGRDYHKTIRHRLAQMVKTIESWCQENQLEEQHRGFVDSAPVLEKPLAEKSGQGWIGKHSLLLNKAQGSWFFLGEILTSLPLPIDTKEAGNACGNCRACLKVCPTDAFPEPYVLDANRCISYLTIENRGPIPEPLRAKMGNRVFGCDDCQLVCPWNRYAQHSGEADFQPRHKLQAEQLRNLYAWTESEFLQKTAGSPIRRAGYEGWQRNLAVGLGNARAQAENIHALESKKPVSSMVEEHINWALHRLKTNSQTLNNN